MATLNITIPDADETTKGIAEVATQVETDAGTDDTKMLTPLKLEQSDLVQTDVAANTAKTTNATHTGEVTGSVVLTVNKTSISNKTLVTALAGDHVLIGDASDSDNLKKVNVSDFLGGGGQSYTLGWLATTFSPADSTRYWITPWDSAPTTGTNGNRKHKIPVTASEFTLNVGMAANGTTEGVTWVIRNHTQATEANFSPTHAWTSGGQANAWYGTATLSCTAGDYLEIVFDTPVWSTNPTGVRLRAYLNFQAD